MKNLSRLARNLYVLVAVSVFATGANLALSADINGVGWKGKGATNNWSDSGNWDNADNPVAGDRNLFFGNGWRDAGGNGFVTSNNDLSFTGYRITFQDNGFGNAATSFTLQGNAVTLADFGGNSPGVENDSGLDQSINFNTTFKSTTGSAFVTDNNGNVNFGGTVTLDNTNAFQFNLQGNSGPTINFTGAVNNGGMRIAQTGNENVSFAGGLSGSGDFLKQGSGTATFKTATTSFTGGVFIDNGTVAVGTGGSIGATNGTTTGLISMGSTSSAQSANNTTVNIVNSGVTLANPIDARWLSGQTNGVKTIGGTFTSGSSTYSGNITLHDNVVLSAANGGTVIFSGVIATAGSGTTTVLPTGITFGGTPDVQINTGGSSTGIVEFDNAMTYAADTFVNSGTLQFNGSGSLANSTIRLGQQGAATLNMIAAGGSTLNVTVNVRSSAGTKTISASNTSGTATLGGHFALDDNATVTEASSGGTLAITQARAGGAGTTTGTDIKGFTLTLTPTGTINISGDVYNSTGSGSILMNGSGTASLSGVANTYSGTTTLSSGTLQGSTAAFSATPTSPFGTSGLQLNGGILQLRSPGATGSGTGNTTAETVTFGNNTTVGGTTTIDVDRTAAATAATNKTIALGTLSIGANTLNVTGTASHAYALSFGATTLTGNAAFSLTGANLTLGDITGGANTISISRTGGTGIVFFTGANDNASGLVTVTSGELDLNKTAGKNGIGASGVNVSGGTLKLLAANQIADAATVSVGTTGVFNSNGNTETINGLSLTGGATVSGAGPLLLNSGGVTIDASTAGPSISANVTINQAQSWSSNSSTNSTSVSGSANNFANLLTLNGGLFTFSSGGSSTGAGGVKITSGATVIDGASSGSTFFGTGTVEFNSGTYKNSTASTSKTLANPYSITGDFTFDSGGATGNNVFTGGGSTTGTRTITANTATTSFTTNALTLGGNLTSAGSGALTLSGGLNLGAADRTITGGATGATTISGAVDSSAAGHKLVLGGDKVTVASVATGATNTVNFEVNATGVVTFGLGGTNTYAGNTTVTAGTLAATQSGVVSAGGAITSGSIGKGTLALNDTSTFRSNSTTARTLQNSLSLAGNVTLGDATNNGALTFNSTDGTHALTTPATISLTANTALTTASNVVFDDAINGGGFTLSKSGAGTLTLSGSVSNSSMGAFSLSAGELDLSKTGGATAIASNTINVTGGTMLWLAGSTNEVSASARITLTSGGAINLNGATQTVMDLTNNGGTFVTGAGSWTGTSNSMTFGAGSTNTINAGGVVSDIHVTVTGGTNNVQAGGALNITPTGTGLEMNGGTLNLNSSTSPTSPAPGRLSLMSNVVADDGTSSAINTDTANANPGAIQLNGADRTFTVGSSNAATSLSISASIQGTSAGIIKGGPGSLVLTGNNTFSGATTVNASGGTLNAGAAGALGSTSSITVNGGGTLAISGSGILDRINNSAGISLNGGTFMRSGTGTVSEGVGATTTNNGATHSGTSVAGLGALTLASTSTLDFGTGGVGTLVFSDFVPNGNVLNISNYMSAANGQTGVSGTDGTDDRLIFMTNQSSDLANFNFGTGLTAVQIMLGDGSFEITAVPETSTWVAGALALSALLVAQRRRLSRPVLQKILGK